MRSLGIEGCAAVPVRANSDSRGCLFEIYREEWDGAFETVQWNACASSAGVMRGVHAHVDYSEFYTLPKGRVYVALKDIRRDSPTFMQSTAFEWMDTDGFAVTVPPGVAHAVYFFEDSVLTFGLSGYWKAELDILGCRWDDAGFGIDWPIDAAQVSNRDSESGTFEQMIEAFEAMAVAVSG